MVLLRKSKDLIHHTEEEVYSALFQLVVFACMLITTTVLAVSSHDKYMYQFDSNINRVFLKREYTENTNSADFENLITTQEWYAFLESVFLKHWHSQNFASDSDGNALKTPVFLRENFHVGLARIRQMRVKPNSCIIHDVFNRYFNSCYVRYAEEYESTEPTFKGSKYYTEKKFPVAEIQGLLGKYKGPGYVVFLTRDGNQNTALVQHLKAIRWVDRATRLLVIEFVLYNSNMNMFINAKLITEVLPTSTVLSSYEVQFLPLYSIWSTKKPLKLITSTIFVALVIFYTAEEYWFFRMYGMWNYLRSKWNYLDCAILITAYIALVFSLIHPYRMNKRLYTILKNENGDIFIDDLCYWHTVFKLFLTTCAILVWLKIFRFISFNLTMLHFSMAIGNGFKDMIGFSLMFFIVFVAYSMLGMILFSDMNQGFASFSKSLVTMMRMIMGDYQYQNIEKADSILGPIFFISYILFIFFILLNMFLAVISGTYVEVKEGLKSQRSSIRTKLNKVWKKTIRFITRCCRRKKSKEKSKTPEGDDPDDPRTLDEDEALKEFYGSARSSIEEFEGTITFEQPKRTSDSNPEFAKLTHKVEALEYQLEMLIAKMDRIIKIVDARVEEEKAARSLGKKI